MRVFHISGRYLQAAVFILAIVLSFPAAVRPAAVSTFAMPVSKKIVLLDAGHGAWDPGKVAGNVLEKDINLQITKKLQAFLEEGGATVIVTRDDDSGLASSKSGDMNSRRLTANASKADIFVSIHQNSFTSAGVRGAQVFFFNQSDSSMKLAQCVQSRIKGFADADNRFQPKPNASYYVLRQTEMPAVLVECGFLSNADERRKLGLEEYQEKIAWAIYLGIVDYFNGE